MYVLCPFCLLLEIKVWPGFGPEVWVEFSSCESLWSWGVLLNVCKIGMRPCISTSAFSRDRLMFASCTETASFIPRYLVPLISWDMESPGVSLGFTNSDAWQDDQKELKCSVLWTLSTGFYLRDNVRDIWSWNKRLKVVKAFWSANKDHIWAALVLAR